MEGTKAHPRALMERLIRANADEINRLPRAIRESAALRWRDPERRLLHSQACAAFHPHYERLAFPGGYANALKQLADHDPDTLDVALATGRWKQAWMSSSSASTMRCWSTARSSKDASASALTVSASAAMKPSTCRRPIADDRYFTPSMPRCAEPAQTGSRLLKANTR